MSKRKTIYVKLKDDIDERALDTLMDRIQDVPGVFSVTMADPPHDPRQLSMFPDEPDEQKLFPIKTTIKWPDGSTEVSEGTL